MPDRDAAQPEDHKASEYAHPPEDLARPGQEGENDMTEQDGNADEGADPSEEIRRQNSGETTTADLTDDPAPDDPHKAEKLARAGRDGFDPNADSEGG